MSLDLKKLTKKLDEALSNETTETLTKFLTDKTMNNKQSSVDWFGEQLKEKMQMWNSTKNYQEFHIVLEAGEFYKLIEQAKAMHKEEIENAFVECWKANMPDGYECKLSAKEYYNETFGGNNEQQ